MRLTSHSNEVSARAPEFAAALRRAGVRTVQALLCADPERLSQISEIPRSAIEQYALNMSSSLTSDPVDAQVCASAACERGVVSTGLESLDDLLGGGLRLGEVCEIIGESGAGKTQLCLSICASLIASTDSDVIYLDATLAFDSDRLRSLVRNQLIASRGASVYDDSQQLRHTLDAQLRICLTEDTAHLCHTLEELRAEFSRGGSVSQRSARLIVLDSISGVFAAETAAASSSGAGAQLAWVRTLLRDISARFGVATLVTNSRSNFLAHGSRANSLDALLASKGTLGNTWAHAAHTRLLVEALEDQSIGASGRQCSVTLIKCSSLCRRRSLGQSMTLFINPSIYRPHQTLLN